MNRNRVAESTAVDNMRTTTPELDFDRADFVHSVYQRNSLEAAGVCQQS